MVASVSSTDPVSAPGWDAIALPTGTAELVESLAGSSQSLDPYVLWHSATHPQAERKLPIAIEFVADSGWENDALLRAIVPGHYHGRRFGTARVALRTELLTLLGRDYNRYIVRIRLGWAWGAPQVPDKPSGANHPVPGHLAGRVMAVIDDGCAYAHERFRWLDAQGRWRTRIAYLWDQGGAPGDGSQALPHRPVVDFGYGHELWASDIDALMAAHTDAAGVVDEDAVYRDAPEVRTTTRALHGTHVLDLAAGAPDGGSVDADDAPTIVFVQLPRDVVRDTSGGWMNVHVLDALWYVHSRVAADAKLVINISFGAMAGPHDGSSILEQALDDFCAVRPVDCAVVLPAGNAHGTDCHAVLELPARAGGSFAWRVRPDDPTDSFIEFYAPSGSQLEASLLPPGLAASPPIDANRAWLHRNGLGRAQCALVHLAATPSEAEQRLFVMLAPCDPQDRTIGAAPAGDWTLRLTNRGDAPVTVHGWIERDGRSDGWPYQRGSQARFLAELPVSRAAGVLARVATDGTLNSLAHGRGPIVVGACVGGEPLRLAAYSGSGPSREPGGRTGPDLVAIADEGPTFDGVMAAGSRSGDHFRLNGTSVAAPQVARWLLDHLSRSSMPQTLAQIKAALRDQALARPVQGSPGENAAARALRCGAGCIDPQGRAMPTGAPSPV